MDGLRDAAYLLGIILVFTAIALALTVVALLVSALGAWAVS